MPTQTLVKLTVAKGLSESRGIAALIGKRDPQNFARIGESQFGLLLDAQKPVTFDTHTAGDLGFTIIGFAFAVRESHFSNNEDVCSPVQPSCAC